MEKQVYNSIDIVLSDVETEIKKEVSAESKVTNPKHNDWEINHFYNHNDELDDLYKTM